MNTIADVCVKSSDVEDAETEVVKSLLHYIIRILNFVGQSLGENKFDSIAKEQCLKLKDSLNENLDVTMEIVQHVFDTAESIEKCILDDNKTNDL